MDLFGASPSNQTDFKPQAGTVGIQPTYETNIYLESVLPSDVNMPFSFKAGNPKVAVGKTIDGFIPLLPNPLVSTNNTDQTFTPQYDYLRAQGK